MTTYPSENLGKTGIHLRKKFADVSWSLHPAAARPPGMAVGEGQLPELLAVASSPMRREGKRGTSAGLARREGLLLGAAVVVEGFRTERNRRRRLELATRQEKDRA
ncbi:unnamed protein product [Urochloa humidicola]